MHVQLALSNGAYSAEVELCDQGNFEDGRRMLGQLGSLDALSSAQFPSDMPSELPARIEQTLAGCPKITVTPENSTVAPGDSVTFVGTSEDPADTHFTFSSSDGRISPISGEYLAGEEEGRVTVTATSSEHPDHKGTTALTIGCSPTRRRAAEQCEEVAIEISPQAVTLQPGATQQFTATVTGTSDTRVSWSASCGSVGQAGLYTAPEAEENCTVTAASVAVPSKQAAATVEVSGGVLVDDRSAIVQASPYYEERDSELPVEGVFTTSGSNATGASAGQTSNVQASATGNAWLTVDETAVGPTGASAVGYSEHHIRISEGAGRTLSCSGSFSVTGRALAYVGLGDDIQLYVGPYPESTADSGSGDIDFELPLADAGQVLDVQVGADAPAGAYARGDADLNLTCHIDGRVRVPG